MHPLMFLSAGHDQVLAFFDVCAADVLAMRPTLAVVGDVRSAVEVATRFELTRERIRQLEQGALAKLRGLATASQLIDYLS